MCIHMCTRAFARARDVARCRTVVSICRTVIIDCRIPRDGATLRALNTASEGGHGGPRSCTTHTKRARCRYASVISFTSATASPIARSPSLSVTRLFARVSDPAPTRSTVRSISSSSCSSSVSSTSSSLRGRSRKLLFHLTPFANSSRATRYPGDTSVGISERSNISEGSTEFFYSFR